MKQFLIAGLALVLLGVAGPAAAQVFDTNVELEGYAWSSNVGWISFNGPGYEVVIEPDAADGVVDNVANITGYAWNSAPGPDVTPLDGAPDYNSGVGWIKFGGLGTSPLGGDSTAQIDLVTGVITGWARVCVAAPDQINCTGAGSHPDAGDWDGWIALRGTASNGDSYGVAANTSPLTNRIDGFSWGGGPTASSSVIGWMSWSGTAGNGSPYAVTYTPPCAGDPVLQCLTPADWEIINKWCVVTSSGACDVAAGAWCAPGGCLTTAPTGSITINPLAVRPGGTTQISWNTSDAASCTVEQQNAGGDAIASWTGTNDSQPSQPISRVTVFSLQCTSSPDPTAPQFEIASTTLRILPTFIET